MKFLFFGTPEFSAIILEKLIAAGYAPAAIVCNPDELIGKKQIFISSPVKQLIIHYELEIKDKIKIFQPATKAELLAISDKLRAIKPDLAIVAAYGKIIPEEILNIPSCGFINVHPSLLPKYRGASPIQYAILNGDKETGVTVIKLDEEMDHGPILAISELQIANSKIAYSELSKKLAELGAELLIETIPYYVSGKIKPAEQNHSKETYTKIIKKEDGKIDWKKSAREIERMTRAYYPWPSAWTNRNEKILKIIEAEVSENKNERQIGEIFLDNNQLSVKCGDGNLVIKKLQLEGGKILAAKDFLNGHKDFIGSILK